MYGGVGGEGPRVECTPKVRQGIKGPVYRAMSGRTVTHITERWEFEHGDGTQPEDSWRYSTL
jgi:hypothetical protein